jgi:hypothetical protein
MPDRSTKETREYAQAVKKGLDSYFVVQNGKGWYVRKASAKNGKLFSTKNKAFEHAKQKATKKRAEVIVFNNKGALLHRQST